MSQLSGKHAIDLTGNPEGIGGNCKGRIGSCTRGHERRVRYEKIGNAMRPAIWIDYACGRVIAHDTSAARMPIVELDILRKKDHPATLESLCQELSKVSDAIPQFILDRVFHAHAVGFVVVEYNPVLRVRHILNKAYENSSTAKCS